MPPLPEERSRSQMSDERSPYKCRVAAREDGIQHRASPILCGGQLVEGQPVIQQEGLASWRHLSLMLA
jgi:hypothetical protein